MKRREFIKKTGLTVSSAFVAPYILPSGRLFAAGYADQWPSGATWGEVRSGQVNENFILSKNDTREQQAQNRRIKIIFGVK